jgi:hypothetical protein
MMHGLWTNKAALLHPATQYIAQNIKHSTKRSYLLMAEAVFILYINLEENIVL